MVVVVEVDSDLAFALAKSTDLFRQWARVNGVPVPVALGDLASSVTAGQGRTRSDGRDAMADGGPVLPMLYDAAQVAALLQVSERTVRRLIAQGDLHPVRIGSCKRVPHDELAAYVQRLRDQGRV